MKTSKQQLWIACCFCVKWTIEWEKGWDCFAWRGLSSRSWEIFSSAFDGCQCANHHLTSRVAHFRFWSLNRQTIDTQPSPNHKLFKRTLLNEDKLSANDMKVACDSPSSPSQLPYWSAAPKWVVRQFIFSRNNPIELSLHLKVYTMSAMTL